MPRKIIIDCDPGIDDAIAITMAVFDPRVEVLAVTATTGTVPASTSTANVHAIINQLDPPRYPRIGAAQKPDGAPVSDDLEFHGPGGLGEFEVDVAQRQHETSSEKVMADLIHAHPDEVTIVCLGPLTNVARLFRRDPAAIDKIDRLIISGGAITAAGNATPSAEHNMYFDPVSAGEVLSSPTTKLMIPLDVTESVAFGVEVLEQLPSLSTGAGRLLHRTLPYMIRMYHDRRGQELIPLHDPLAMLATLQPNLFEFEPMAVRVEDRGTLTRGTTVSDRRFRPQWPFNVDVATGVDAVEAEAMVIRSLRFAGQQTA
ncbi:MAG: nucleoside hydrolase [Planctomycetota bacterium]